MSEVASAVPAKGTAGESAFGRLVGVFLSPARTFASIAARPTWILPVAISAALSLPLSELILSKTNWREVVSAQIAKSGRTLSEAQLDAAVEQSRKLAWVWDVAAVAAPILVTLIVAAALWGACNAFGWEVKFRQSLGVTAHSYFPGVLYGLGLLAALWNRPTVDPQKIGNVLPTNLGYLAPGADPVSHGLLASVDFFSFWTIALLVLGLSAAAKTSRGRMAVLVVSLWALYVLGKAGATALVG
jgi:Yip1 domain